MTRATWVVGLVPYKLGGFERTCVEFARQAQARGIKTDIVFEGEPCEALAQALAAAGATHHVIPDVGVLGWKQALSLWRHLWRTRPAIVHLHFCEFYVPFFAMMTLLRIPLVATYHYSGEPVVARGIRRWLKQLRLLMFRGPLRRITAVSATARQKFLGDYLERPERVTVVYNGTDLYERQADVRRLDASQESPERRAGPRVLFVGSLIPEKGPQIAIRALALAAGKWPAISLSIAGDGPEIQELRHLAKTLGISERVAFLGLRDDIPEMFSDHDMMVMPSIWREAFGYVLIEAMAMGCPVIASSVGAIPEIVADGEEGLLVPPGDAGALAAAIAKLWSDPKLRQRLAANSLHKVRRVFSAALIVREYWALYG